MEASVWLRQPVPRGLDPPASHVREKHSVAHDIASGESARLLDQTEAPFDAERAHPSRRAGVHSGHEVDQPPDGKPEPDRQAIPVAVEPGLLQWHPSAHQKAVRSHLPKPPQKPFSTPRTARTLP